MASKATQKKKATTSRTISRKTPVATSVKGASSRAKARTVAAKSAAPVKRSGAQKTPAIHPLQDLPSAQLFQFPNSDEVSKATQQAQETMRAAAENLMKTSNEMMQFFNNANQSDAFEGAASQASHAAEEAFSFSRDAITQVTQLLQEMAYAPIGVPSVQGNAMILRENIEAITECANTLSKLSKQIMAHVVAFSNRAFNEKVEFSKAWLSCRTLNDLFDATNQYNKGMVESFFTEAMSLSEILFKGVTEAANPIHNCINESAEHTRKMMGE